MDYLETVALIVPSCDKYFDVIDQFFDRQERFMGWWDTGRYVITEEKEYHRKGVISITSGLNKEWSNRIRDSIEKMPEEYFLFLLDDYFMYKEVKEIEILQALEYMICNNIKYYKLVNNPKLALSVDGYEFLSPIPNNIRYGINLAEFIIQKDFFLELLGDEGKSIWRVEADPLLAVTDMFSGYIEGCVSDKRNILQTKYAIMKGKWVPSTLKLFLKIGMPIETGERKVLSKTENIKLILIGKLNKHLSPKSSRIIKEILKRFGFKFASMR